jgi:hypothetical protein
MATEYASADDLIDGAPDLPEADLELSNGRTVRLRGLSRQGLFFNGKGTEDPAVVEARNLVSCMVRPQLSLDQATAMLRKLPAGDGSLISRKIRELSGLDEGAPKSVVAEVRD